MLKAQIAELILALFVSRERASSTVGDLMEEAPERGVWWFWLHVFRTALLLFWDSFSSEPYFLAALGLRGLILNLFLWLAYALCIPIFFTVCYLMNLDVFRSSTGDLRFGWAIEMASWTAMFAIQFQTGGFIARRARDKEIAACAAFRIIVTIAGPLIGEILVGGHWLDKYTNSSFGQFAPHMTAASIALAGVGGDVALFIGALLVRYRASRQQPA